MGGRTGQTLLPIGLGLGAGGLGALGGAGLAGMGPLAKWLGPAQAAAAGQAAATPGVQQVAGALGGGAAGGGGAAAPAAGSDAALQQQAKDITSGMANQLNTASSRYGAGGQGAMPLPGQWDQQAKQFAQGYADQLTGKGPLPDTATTPGGGPDVGGLASNAQDANKKGSWYDTAKDFAPFAESAMNAVGGGGGQQQPQAPAPPPRRAATPAPQGGGAAPTVQQVPGSGQLIPHPHTQNIGPPVGQSQMPGTPNLQGPMPGMGTAAGMPMDLGTLYQLLQRMGGGMNRGAQGAANWLAPPQNLPMG